MRRSKSRGGRINYVLAFGLRHFGPGLGDQGQIGEWEEQAVRNAVRGKLGHRPDLNNELIHSLKRAGFNTERLVENGVIGPEVREGLRQFCLADDMTEDEVRALLD